MSRPKQSAGLLMYRMKDNVLQVFIVHPGGPYFAKKDNGFWSIPKGEIEQQCAPLEVAVREFHEETGQEVETCAVSPEFLPLGSVVQKNGKQVQAWAFQGDWPEGAEFQSNSFTMEWPPHSGQIREFPEVDRGAFLEVQQAREKINTAQAAFIDRLIASLS